MSDGQVSAHYQDFIRKKELLDNLIGRLLQLLEDLDMYARKQEVEQLAERLRSNSFKVLVMGEFKRGKSTLINALLGEKVLPAFANPTTAIINEIKMGIERRAVLHYLPTSDGFIKQPIEIPVEKISEYVVIKNNRSTLSLTDTTYESPYEKVELFWPFELCRDGVEIIDSPGLNEDVGRQKITLEYLKSVDVVLYVVACDFPVSLSELQVVQVIKDAGHEHIFFICNRINMIDEEEVQEVKARCINILAPQTKEGKEHVIFVNARGALTGRMKHNEEQIIASNIHEVEYKLKNFLAYERGRIKLLPTAHRMRAAIRESWNTLPIKEKLCHVSLQDLQSRYHKTERELSHLEYERKQIYAQLSTFRADIRKSINDAAIDFYNYVIQEIKRWTEEYTIKDTENSPFVIFSKKRQEQVAVEVTTYLADKVRWEFQRWANTVMEPHLTAMLVAEMQKLDERTRSFSENLERVGLELVSDVPDSIVWQGNRRDEVSAFERILATASGVLVGDVSSVWRGSRFGLNETVQTTVLQVVLAGVAFLAVGWNPLILIPTIVLGGLVQALFRTDPINRKIRDTVGQEYKRNLQENLYPLANQVSNIAEQKIMDIQRALDMELMLQVQNIRDQVSAIINLKQQEEGNIQLKIQALNAVALKLNEIDNELDDLIEKVALSRLTLPD